MIYDFFEIILSLFSDIACIFEVLLMIDIT